MKDFIIRKSTALFIAAIALSVSFLLFDPVHMVYADDSGTTDGTDGSAADVIEVTTMNELTSVLSRGSQQGAPLMVRLLDSNNGYTASKTLSVPDHVTLDLNGHTISGNIQFIVALAGTDATVTNGTLDGGGVKVSSDIAGGSISKLAIKNAEDNGIQVTGVMGSINDNTITSPGGSAIHVSGGKVSKGIKNNIIKKAGNMGIRLFAKAVSGDIADNTVYGCKYHGISLNGSTGTSTNDGASCKDIRNNTITNCKGDGISLYHGSHAGKITKNVLSRIGGHDTRSNGDFGIIINGGCKYKTYAKEITYNEVSDVTFASIVVFSGPKGTSRKWQYYGYIGGDIAHNKVNNSGTVKKKVNWNKKPKYPCEGAIYVDSHARVKGSIHHNTVNTSYDNGICVLEYSTVKSIYNNNVKNCSNAGISVTNRSKVTGTISNNKVSNSKRYGIFANNRSSIIGAVSKNTIKTAGLSGVFISQGSAAGTVTKNEISNIKLYGVIAGAKSKISNLTYNTISVSNANTGIGVISNTSCLIRNITGNKISGKYGCGIRVKSPTGRIKILRNTLKAGSPKSKKTTGISVDGCKKRKIAIKFNKIVGNNTGAGIYIINSAGIVRKNKISRVRVKVSAVKGKYKVKK